MRWIGPAGLLVVLCCAQGTMAEDAVFLRVSQPGPGERVRVTENHSTTSTRTTTINGARFGATDQNSTAWVYVGEINQVSRKDRQHTVKRTYHKYQVLHNGQVEAGPPLHTPISISVSDDALRLTAGKKQLHPSFVARVEAELTLANQGITPIEMLPKHAVKPGESWKIDPSKAFLGTGKLALDAERGSMTGKLVKSYEKSGRRYATMEFSGIAPVKSLGPDIGLIPKDGSVANLTMTVEACVDGTVPYSRTTGRIKFRVEAEINGGSVLLESDSQRNELIEAITGK